MKYAYNGNLDFSERVSFVANEICSEYPLVSNKDALIAASHAHSINDYVTNDDKFNRLYYILMTIGRNHDEFLHVFNDIFKVYEEGLNNTLYKDTMIQIINYVIGERDTFPIFLEG